LQNRSLVTKKNDRIARQYLHPGGSGLLSGFGLVGETLWAHGSMFILTGQIMTLMALVTSPLYWNSWLET